MNKVKVTRVLLEKLVIQVDTVMPRHLPGYLSEVAIAQQVTGDWTLQLRRHIYGKQMDRMEVRHPATWWDAFKARWAPRWWLRRHPAAYTCHVMQATAYWPTIKDLVPDHRPVLHLVKFDHTERGEDHVS